jgi:hypothetical protein
MVKNIVEPDRPQMKVLCMRVACWIPKATNTQSEYVMFNAFPLPQWSHKRSSMLRYTRTYIFLNMSVEFFSLTKEHKTEDDEKCVLSSILAPNNKEVTADWKKSCLMRSYLFSLSSKMLIETNMIITIMFLIIIII